MKKKLAEIKTKIKKHAPELICASLTIAAVTYATILKNQLAEEKQRFPEGGRTKLGVNKCCFSELTDGQPVIWDVNGHQIDIAYDPDC
jgi:hypothetical protein